MANWMKLEHIGDKWELKHKGVVLGTIFHQPINGKFAVWVSTPLVVRQVQSMATKSHEFDSFTEAQQGFDNLLREHVSVWAEAVNSYLDEIE